MRPLGKYLNEHWAGSHGALNLLKALARGNASAAATYQALHEGILHNRLTLERLIDQAGFHQARGMELAARLASRVALLRFRSHGLDHGSLGLVEALEALALGIHGQTLLWHGLRRQQGGMPQWEKADFEALLRSAELQKETVEALRQDAVSAAFFNHPSTQTHRHG